MNYAGEIVEKEKFIHRSFMEINCNMATFKECHFEDMVFEKVKFNWAFITRCTFLRCRFIDCNFDEATFHKCRMLQCTFEDSNMGYSRFSRSRIFADFKNATNLSKTKFDYTALSGSALPGIIYLDGRHVYIETVPEKSLIEGVDLHRAKTNCFRVLGMRDFEGNELDDEYIVVRDNYHLILQKHRMVDTGFNPKSYVEFRIGGHFEQVR